jgi:predicted protein tyrosine phosphatase
MKLASELNGASSKTQPAGKPVDLRGIGMNERVRVSCLRDAAEVARVWQSTHVVSLVDPDLAEADLPKIPHGVHRVYRLFDQERADATEHFDALVAEIVADLERAAQDPQARVVVHCHAGVSRSSGLAYGLLALAEGPGREQDAFDALLRITRKPWPNRRVVEAVDRALDRGGALLVPLDAYRARHPRRIHAWHRFNARRGLPQKVRR